MITAHHLTTASSISLRLILVFVGSIILLTVVPHINPWTMSHVSTEYQGLETLIQIQLQPLNWLVKFSIKTWIWCIAVCFSISLSFQSVRQVLVSFFLPPQVAKRLFVIMLFLFTMWPLSKGWSTVLYLICGSGGVCLIMISFYPILRWMAHQNQLAEIAHQFWRLISKQSSLAFSTLIFLLALFLTNLGSYYLFDRTPHVTDSVVQLFHGRIFASGRLYAPEPELKEFFDFNPLMIMKDGKWYSVFPPGHVLMIMLGVLIGSPWLVNPILGSATVVLIYFLGKEVYDENTGKLAGILACFCSFLLVMSSGFMNHATALFCGTLFMLFFARTTRRQRRLDSFIAGIGLGWMASTRPFTAVLVSIPFCIYSVILMIKKPRMYLACFLTLATAVLLIIVMLLSYNYVTNGNPMLFGYVVQFTEGHNPGFGKSPPGQTVHTPSHGLVLSFDRLNFLNLRLFEWPIPSLIFVLVLFLSGVKNRWDLLMGSVLITLAFGYFFYWYSVGSNLIPRFLYESVATLVLLTVRGLIYTPKFVRDILQIAVTERLIRITLIFSLILCFAFMVGLYILPIQKYYANDFYTHINTDPLQATKAKKISNAIIFVDQRYYRGVFPQNHSLLTGDIVFAIDRGDRNQLLMDQYPNRKFYRSDGKDLEEITSYSPN
ncbi:TPA: hypothetical protein EYN09_09030 [Candidatus Poribacteria bacterium]|nr:hypothetical protein [Candidatus Poribacteria bacterium]HIC00112.1 hypothetical protein [Candidatus Poribacteria bacterium]HIN28940.1 hypothetical protein [Candidatus Poribacteria bacterium]HIO07044.1 hypothetical protein [Candidatus Poribacteria bacterium]HIO46220.1 hypothetical protein [Candidatus Poribacteria bacterium]